MLIHGLSPYDPKLEVRCNDCGHTLRAHGCGAELTCCECPCGGWAPVEIEVERVLALFVAWAEEEEHADPPTPSAARDEAMDAYDRWRAYGRSYIVPRIPPEVEATMDHWIIGVGKRVEAWWRKAWPT